MQTTTCSQTLTSSFDLMAKTTTSALKMASLSKFSYHRLIYEGEFDDEEEERAFRNIRKWSRFRKFTIRKRAKLRIPVLRRFWKKRKRFFSRVKVSWGKAWKRLKNGQAHMTDLFGGNYLFIQANPTPRCRCRETPFVGHNNIHGLPSRYPLGKIA